MKQGYAFQGFEKEKMARALGKDLPISMKHASMVCQAIKGKKVQRARDILTDSIELKKAIPFTRFNRDKGHKPKIGPGRYVPKTCIEILKVLNSAESNGNQKSLGDMMIIHACAHKASSPWHFGRWRRRQMKRSHIEIIVAETKTKKEEKTDVAPKKEIKADKETKEEKKVEKEKPRAEKPEMKEKTSDKKEAKFEEKSDSSKEEMKKETK